MKLPRKWNLVLDIIMLVLAPAVYCIKGQYHETLAYTIATLIAIHIAWHWKQYSAMIKNRSGSRNIVLDLAMFLVMLSLFFVKDNLHETLAYIMGILMIIHFVWHWKQFKTLYNILIPKTVYRYLVGVLTAVLLAAVLTAPLYLTIDKRVGHGGYGDPPHGHGYRERGRI